MRPALFIYAHSIQDAKFILPKNAKFAKFFAGNGTEKYRRSGIGTAMEAKVSRGWVDRG